MLLGRRGKRKEVNIFFLGVVGGMFFFLEKDCFFGMWSIFSALLGCGVGKVWC